MNRIKYFNPKTGKRVTQRISQPSADTLAQQYNTTAWRPHLITPHLGTMAQVDKLMRQQGFERDGARWRRGHGPAPHAARPKMEVKPKWYNLAALYKKLRREKAVVL